MNLENYEIDILNACVYGIWKETPEGIDVDGDFDSSEFQHMQFYAPMRAKFNKILGYFSISTYNGKNIVLAQSFPNWIGNDFICRKLQIVSLLDFPKYVGNDLYLLDCFNLKSAEGLPNYIGGKIYYLNCHPEFEVSLRKEMMRSSI